MSVKISRREEKRDTSIRDFSLAAVFPLLLTGLIGYFIGEAGKVDSGVTSSELSVLRDSLQSSKTENLEVLLLTQQLDSLLNIFEESFEARKEAFSQATQADAQASPFDSPLERWTSDEQSDEVQFGQTVSRLEGKVRGTNVLQEDIYRPVFTSLRQLNKLRHSYFKTSLFNYRSQTSEQRETTDILLENEEDCDERMDQLQADLRIANEKLALKDIRIEKLNTQLSDTGNSPEIEPISYEKQTGEIMTAVMEIEDISRQLPSGLFGGGKKEEVEAKIMKQTSLIKNSLAVIE